MGKSSLDKKLLRAVREGNIEEVGLHLLQGADPEVVDGNGVSALDHAADLHDAETAFTISAKLEEAIARKHGETPAVPRDMQDPDKKLSAEEKANQICLSAIWAKNAKDAANAIRHGANSGALDHETGKTLETLMHEQGIFDEVLAHLSRLPESKKRSSYPFQI